MKSKSKENDLWDIVVIRDGLNIDRASGGYSLQFCWTTGFVAGNNC